MDKAKFCPKCKGNVFIDWDYSDGEWYEYCLQCSYRHYLPVIAKTQPSSDISNTRKKQKRKRGTRNGKVSKRSDVQKSGCAE